MTREPGCTDRNSVIDLLNRYAAALDTKDWSKLRECFTADAVCVYEGFGTFASLDEIGGICKATISPLDASQHLLGNHSVSFTDGSAETTCYVQAQHFRMGTPGGEFFTLGGKYADLVVRFDAGWRISHRTLTTLWSTGNPAVLGDAFTGASVQGSSD